MKRAPVALACVLLLLVCAVVAGCGEATPPSVAPTIKITHADHDHEHKHDHDHGDHEHSETVAAGLEKLEKLCQEVKAELADGDHEEADGKVHMVGHLLDDLRGLVIDAKPSAKVEEAAKKALDDIFECFDKMDTALHSTDPEDVKKLDYADHAPAIDAATRKLRQLFP